MADLDELNELNKTYYDFDVGHMINQLKQMTESEDNAQAISKWLDYAESIMRWRNGRDIILDICGSYGIASSLLQLPRDSDCQTLIISPSNGCFVPDKNLPF